MRIYILAMGWASALPLLAVSARLDWISQGTSDLLLMVVPMIAFVTLLGDRGCGRTARGA